MSLEDEMKLAQAIDSVFCVWEMEGMSGFYTLGELGWPNGPLSAQWFYLALQLSTSEK
jgi:hypothetical protein